MTILLATLLLALTCAWALLRPHLLCSDQRGEASVHADNSLQSIIQRRDRTLELLQDLELDYATGKLNNDEFTALRDELETDITATLHTLDLETTNTSSSRNKNS